MQLIKIVGEQAEVQFSLAEIITLNNSLNEVCNGIELVDFETKIGGSREQAKLLLDSVHKLMDELRSHTQTNKRLHLDKKNSSLAIRKTCILEANGYQVIFYLRSLDYSKQSIGIIVVLAVAPDLGGVSVRSAATTIRIEDLRILITYLEQHINNLKEDPNKTLHTFSPNNTTFQVQASSGNFVSEDEGFFTIRFMVNVGSQEHKGNTSTYVGAEAVVLFKNIRSFTSLLQAALNEFSYSK